MKTLIYAHEKGTLAFVRVELSSMKDCASRIAAILRQYSSDDRKRIMLAAAECEDFESPLPDLKITLTDDE